MKKTEIVKGPFVVVECCSECDWFDTPWIGFPTPPISICPKCGNNIVDVRGRYISEKITTGIFFKKEKFNVINFERLVFND